MRRLESRFGEHVRELRAARNLTQDELASRSGVSVDSIRRIERGELSPSLSTVTKLARGLELRLRTLFGGLEPTNGTTLTHQVEQICDYLHQRSPQEVHRAHKVLKAILPAMPNGLPDQE